MVAARCITVNDGRYVKSKRKSVTVIVPRIGAEATVALRKRGNPIHDSRPNRERTRATAKRAAIRQEW
jgi:hypothetical protein